MLNSVSIRERRKEYANFAAIGHSPEFEGETLSSRFIRELLAGSWAYLWVELFFQYSKIASSLPMVFI